MDEHIVNRRRVLMGTGAAVAIGSVAGASSASASSSSGSGLTGSWVVSRKDNTADAVKTTTVISFAAGGVLISQDISPADSVFTGTWEGRGGGGFQGTMWMGQPGPAGPGKPGVTIRVRIRGGWTQGKIWGSYSYTVFDASGAVQTQGTGSFSGRPIDA